MGKPRGEGTLEQAGMGMKSDEKRRRISKKFDSKYSNWIPRIDLKETRN